MIKRSKYKPRVSFTLTIWRWRSYSMHVERLRNGLSITFTKQRLNTPQMKRARAEAREYRDWANQFEPIDLSFDENARTCGKCGLRTMWFMGECPYEYCIHGHAWDAKQEKWVQSSGALRHESARKKFETMRENDLLNIQAREEAIARGEEPLAPLRPDERGMRLPL